jgi:amino acid transporter
MNDKQGDDDSSLMQNVLRALIGKPRDINDPSIFHKLALIPLLAWIGLGADGLSSSSYGPEEAFRHLGSHTYLALILALATAFTVFIISYAYSRIIEHFPYGGGGYIVATRMLGERAGVISGSALVIDYILTITVSIAACADALFSYLPIEFHQFKLAFAALLIMILVLLNIRGVKESITTLAPIFIVFVLTHAFMLGYGIFSHLGNIGPVVGNVSSSLKVDLSTIGFAGILMIFLRSYSLGGGTYTGIEAVSNGLQAMRDPKVHTGKRTMLYMATSLAITAGGLFICYLLLKVTPAVGKTLNSVLADTLFGRWSFGHMLALITILSEGALLMVGAQAGFIDAPRVMANMAVDSWLPHRLASFSDRLTMRNGVLMIGTAAMALLIYTRASISALVVMYSINVFLTFSISEFGMVRYFITHRKRERQWQKHVSVHITGLMLCLTILSVTVFEKFLVGGWLTLVITVLLIAFCYVIRTHYAHVQRDMKKLDDLLDAVKISREKHHNTERVDAKSMTAIQLVGSYGGLGIHTLLGIYRSFPGFYKNMIFVSVAVVDQNLFKIQESLEDLKHLAEADLKKYVKLARRLGFAADYRLGVGTDVVQTAVDLCTKLRQQFNHSTVFTGKLAFHKENFYHPLLHNETAFAIQKQLQWKGITTVILPIRINK